MGADWAEGCSWSPGGEPLRVRCGAPAGLVDRWSPVATIETTLPEEIERLNVGLRPDYYRSFRRRRVRTITVPASEYLAKGSPWARESLLCPEMPLPRELSRSLVVRVSSRASFGAQAIAMVHAGTIGSFAPVHYDWDHKWVAHACLTGKKRFILFPPSAGWLLAPVMNTSALLVPRFAAPDRREIVRRLGGFEIELRAGQGVLFPSMFWHCALYEGPSLSISVRLEPNRRGRPYAALPKSFWLQRMVWEFFSSGYGADSANFLDRYLRCFFQANQTWKDRYRSVSALCRQALLELGRRQGAATAWSDGFSAELGIAANELRGWYTLGDTVPTRGDKLLVSDTAKYLFQGARRRPRYGLKLAKYAVEKRQGLRPRRGFVRVHHQTELT